MITLFLILLMVSILFKLFPPKKINSFYGYRTRKSKLNDTNWKMANKYAANLMLISIFSLLIISLTLELLNLEYDTILIGLLLLTFVIIIVLTEKKLSHR